MHQGATGRLRDGCQRGIVAAAPHLPCIVPVHVVPPLAVQIDDGMRVVVPVLRIARKQIADNCPDRRHAEQLNRLRAVANHVSGIRLS